MTVMMMDNDNVNFQLKSLCCDPYFCCTSLLLELGIFKICANFPSVSDVFANLCNREFGVD